MNGQRRNLILIPVIIAILAATTWSLYNLIKRPTPVPTAAVLAPPTEGFVKLFYQERLKEEGNRTAHVEKLIKQGVLSDKKAAYFKIAKGESK